MTLDEAINYNEITLGEMERQLLHHRASALRLGNEALKLTKRLRKEQGNEYLLLLPGETEG